MLCPHRYWLLLCWHHCCDISLAAAHVPMPNGSFRVEKRSFCLEAQRLRSRLAMILAGGKSSSPGLKLANKLDELVRRLITLVASDWSGCDNIWLTDRTDPSSAVQITHEPYHVVT